MSTTTIYNTLTNNNILCTRENYQSKDPVHHKSNNKTSKHVIEVVLTEGRFPTSVLAELSISRVIS